MSGLTTSNPPLQLSGAVVLMVDVDRDPRQYPVEYIGAWYQYEVTYPFNTGPRGGKVINAESR